MIRVAIGVFLLAISLAFLFGQANKVVFHDATKEAGITFRQSYGDHDMDNIVEGTGTGVCAFDYNNDGWADLYFLNGAWTKGVSNNEGRDLRDKLKNHLFRNNGNGTFTDVTDKAGVGDKTYSLGCSAADYDNDGNIDLYVMNYGPNVLYHNNGNGTFTEVARKAGLADSRFSLSSVWFDYDGDGFLDVYVANYLLYDDGKFRDFYPAAGYPGPLSYSAQPDALYHNNGDGTFKEVTREAGVYRPGRAMSASGADLNNDGRIDILVANDAQENFYFENQGGGKFIERALEMGLAFGEAGQGVSSMGPSIGDVDRNGWLDVYIPDLRYNSLLMGGEKGFRNLTEASGLSVMMGQYSGWAGILFDYDNDGWLDLFVTHGNAHHEYVEEATLARNRGNGVFVDVSSDSGDYFQTKHVGRGAAWLDYDNDGDVDLVIVNINENAVLLRNDGGNAAHWLVVEPMLEINGRQRHALGARVTVSANGLKQIEDMIPVRGYLSQGDARLYFGLGSAAGADEVEIRWPDGTVQKLGPQKWGQFLKPVRKAGGK